MGKMVNKSKIIMLVPYPAQGHVNPMMKLALSFCELGFKPVIVTPYFIHRRIAATIDPKCRVALAPVSDGLEDDAPRDFFSIEKALETHIPSDLETLVRQIHGDIKCVIVDLLASSAIEVARRCGVPVAGFWPAMGAAYRLIESIPHLLRIGLISETGSPTNPGPISLVYKSTPSLSTEELPWLIGSEAARNARFRFWKRTLERSRNLKWLLVNSFSDEEEDECRSSTPCILPVGSQLNCNMMVKSPSFWEEDRSCLRWLDEQKPKSVLYISFGSWVSPIGEGKVRRLALTLEALGQPFIWVVGPSWREVLGPGFVERAAAVGKVVAWAPQLEVLKHEAVGCYLTHCGWSSTVEAIQCQKRLLCYPIAGDQFLNCAYIVDKWKIGVRMRGFDHIHVEESMRKVMYDNEMERRMTCLYQSTLGKEPNLRSRANIITFLAHLNN